MQALAVALMPPALVLPLAFAPARALVLPLVVASTRALVLQGPYQCHCLGSRHRCSDLLYDIEIDCWRC